VIRSETSRLNRLVDDLQKVSRAQAHQLDLHLDPVAAAVLISDAVKAAEPSYASKGVALEAAIEPRVPTIEADTERIAEVLANLLTNALRHTSSGGIVKVSARQRAERLEISVADNGEGIAPEHLDRVFERFYRIDPARSRASGGTGIGLAIVRAIVEAHGGTATATSPGIGSGTTVTLLLPIHRPRSAQ
jgi:two-component system, OmpR family, sensor histidine kinase BaeS